MPVSGDNLVVDQLLAEQKLQEFAVPIRVRPWLNYLLLSTTYTGTPPVHSLHRRQDRHLLGALPGGQCHSEYRRDLPHERALLGGGVGLPFGEMFREGFIHVAAAELERGQ